MGVSFRSPESEDAEFAVPLPVWKGLLWESFEGLMFSEYGENRLSILEGTSSDSLLAPPPPPPPREVFTDDVEYPSSGEYAIRRPGNLVLLSIVEISGRSLALQITGDDPTDWFSKDGTTSIGRCELIDCVVADAAAADDDDD